MGKKRKAKYDDDIPGPGSYNQYKWDNKGRGWTISGRPKTAGKEKSPGPAAYFPSLGKDAPAFSMGGHYRKPYNDELSPGPGDYELNSNWNKGVLMGKEKKLQTAGGYNSQYPGPGAYYLPEKKGKGVYMGEKFYDKEYTGTPGPGTYEHNKNREGPHYSMASTGAKGKYDSVGPGPGAYNYIQSYQQVYNAKHGKSFGHKTGYESKNMGVPGPGTYYLPQSKGKGITMKGRYPDNIYQRSPGPAAYDQNWKTIQAIVDTSKPNAGGTMSKSNGFYPSGSIPGPGSYYSPSKLTHIGGKFGREIRGSDKKSENPGPGYYYIPCTVADVPKYVYPNPDPRYKWV